MKYIEVLKYSLYKKLGIFCLQLLKRLSFKSKFMIFSKFSPHHGEILLYHLSRVKQHWLVCIFDRDIESGDELWTPDGKSVKTFKQLSDAAAIDSPMIVGCGEPFDGSRIPQDLLEFHKEGGGRVGAAACGAACATNRSAALDRGAQTKGTNGGGWGVGGGGRCTVGIGRGAGCTPGTGRRGSRNRGAAAELPDLTAGIARTKRRGGGH